MPESLSRILYPLAFWGAMALGVLPAASAQDPESLAPAAGAPAAAGPAAPPPQNVIIKREGLALRDPKDYNVPLRTVPLKQLQLTAPADGVVREVFFKPGRKAQAQAEAVRFDDTRAKLALEKAKANSQAAKVELKIAEEKGNADLVALAKAHLDAAQADLKLAEFDVEKTIVKIPFAGELHAVDVVPGQFVRAGEPLMLLADTSSLIVEVPGDRANAKTGADLELMVEQSAVKGKVQTALPPAKHFDPLRQLVNSLTTIVVQIDNSKGEFYAGQSVFTKIIPQQPFAPVPTTTVVNQSDGKRKVQVIRQGVVRDIPIDVLTQMGTDKVFVAGAFVRGDELVLSSSLPLNDGTQVRPQVAAVAPAGAAAAPGAPAPRPARPATGF